MENKSPLREALDILVPESCSPKQPFFSDDKIKEVQNCLKLVKDIGVHIYPTRDNAQRATFFDQAKLWHIVKVIIYKLFIDKLINHELVFNCADGKKYWLTEVPEDMCEKYKTVL
jgi:hypothetical protein